MRRDPIHFTFCALLLASVAACALLGGSVKSPIVVDCHDGTTCPEEYDCPPLANPGGRCEYAGRIVEQWGTHASPALDAGR
jgi:hypothetical protein